MALGVCISVPLALLIIKLMIYMGLIADKPGGVIDFLASQLPDVLLAVVAAVPAFLLSVRSSRLWM